MNYSKRLAIVCNTSWGILNYRSSLIKAIQNNGYQVFTIAPRDEYVSKLEALGCIHINFDIQSNKRNPFKDVISVFGYLKLYKKIKPTIVLNYTAKPNIYSTLACSWAGIPNISNISGLGFGFIHETFITKLLKILYKISLRKANYVFLQNPDDFLFFKDLKIIKETKSQILPGSGVNLQQFKKHQISDISKEPFTFLFVSRMMYSKGVLIALKAAKKLYSAGCKNFEVHLLGDQGINNQDAVPTLLLEEWNKQPYVKYLGKSDYVAPYIQKAHCMLLPSYYKEGTPRSLLEALAVGRPIITTNMPGCKETVTDGVNGFIISPKNVDELANSMSKIMGFSQSELQRMGDESHEMAVSKFNEQLVIDAYLNKIEELTL